MIQTEIWNASKEIFETESNWPRLYASEVNPLVLIFSE